MTPNRILFGTRLLAEPWPGFTNSRLDCIEYARQWYVESSMRCIPASRTDCIRCSFGLTFSRPAQPAACILPRLPSALLHPSCSSHLSRDTHTRSFLRTTTTTQSRPWPLPAVWPRARPILEFVISYICFRTPMYRCLARDIVTLMTASNGR